MAGNLTGRLLSNRYIITERIGVGGMAEVYQGQDNVLGRAVAIKVMLPQYAEDPAFTTRFRQEAAAAANLSSPYIVNVYDWGQDAGTYYIVMEYVRGSDLKTAINQRGAINQRKAAEIGAQVCSALSVAHNMDIIHRDIKPQNIMIQPDGNVKVMDFGIARAKNSVMAKTSSVLGTAHYISPEQAQGKDLTATSDIYSLGVVLYEAVTGQLPFDGPDAVSVALKQVNEAPAAPHLINPNIDPSLEAIIMKALEKDPNARFATARAMRRALNDYLAGRPVSLPGVNGGEPVVVGSSSTPTVAIIPPIGAAAQSDVTTVMPATYEGTGRIRKRNNSYRDDSGRVHGNDEGGSSHKGLAIGLAILALLVVAGIAAFLVFGRGGIGGTEVPDVTGQSVAQATSTIEKAGFRVGTTTNTYSNKEAGTVIDQDPKARTKQSSGTAINLVVSAGAEQVSVPDLSDMTASEARSALTRAGLSYEAGAAEHSDTVEENHVLRQSPEAGEMVEKGTMVTYYLSAGPDATPIPQVVGELEGAAQAKLENAGFKVTIDRTPSSTVPEGQVISQDPKAGEKAKSGTTVNVVVSTGSEFFSVSCASANEEAGSVSPTWASVERGKSAVFYVTANSGYHVTGAYDSAGNSYTVSGGAITVEDVQLDLAITVMFEEDSEPTPSPSSGGSSSKSGTSAASTGSTSKTS